MRFLNTAIFTTLCAVLPAFALADDKSRPGDVGAKQQPSETRTRWTGADTARVLRMLHEINLEEIDAGKIARATSESEGVKAYGEMLLDHHEDADEDVKDLADDKKVTLAARLPADSDAAALLTKLRGLRGAAFDRTFLDAMINGHEKAIDLVTKWRADTSDAKLRELLDELLPTLHKHHDEARKIAKQS